MGVIRHRNKNVAQNKLFKIIATCNHGDCDWSIMTNRLDK